MNPRFDADSVLEGLKDFQLRTVEYAFRRLFLDEQPARRFLVADEVGLGKTMVAKGLVAKAIEHLQDTVKRVDVIYVCSNADIAAQNVKRLRLPGLKTFAKATRLTLLPLETDNLKKHKINFISFTPGTTFDQGNRGGMMQERALIYQMLKDVEGINIRGLLNALQVTAGERWFTVAKETLRYDQSLADKFRKDVLKNNDLMALIETVALRFQDRRTTRSLTQDDKHRRLHLVSQLRKQLAKSCLDALEPDLVILDEFQRFRELLANPEDNPAADLAHTLFNYPDLRILLLSATPYKMYAADAEEEDHYKDFMHTMGFLMEDPAAISALNDDLKSFRSGLLGQSHEKDIAGLQATRERVEQQLLRYMCRTERVGKTIDQGAMVLENPLVPTLQASDLDELRLMASLGNLLGERDNVEYWKSSPYLLNFMKDYQFKKAFDNQMKNLQQPMAELFNDHQPSLLHEQTIDRYRVVDPGNARLRALWQEIDKQQLWKLLWMPASLSYWQPQGSYANLGSISKQLVFSAWNMVPDALACLLSYLAEQRVMEHAGYKGNYKSMLQRFSQRLRFHLSQDGKPSTMTTLLMLYPSPTLARLADPLTIIAKNPDQLLSLDEIRQSVAGRLRVAIKPFLNAKIRSGAPDRRWYWIAIARLDAKHAPTTLDWCKEEWLTVFGAREKDGMTDFRDRLQSDATLQTHIEQWVLGTDQDAWQLGPIPDDLVEVITDIALGGHAICALRALGRHTQGYAQADHAMLTAAAHIAQGLRSQFNLPTTVALLHRDGEDDAYWQRVLKYGLDGNLQALLDEYAHQLRESLNLGDCCQPESLQAIASEMVDSMSIRTATLRPDTFRVERHTLYKESLPIRSHFALRFGEVTDETGAVNRKEVVRKAFNSPFRPFVLASTSVGQEGLDFHTWCHSIIHWNLPSNPVDLEQREGRVHRYKGFAVRKNIARDFRHAIANISAQQDPWAVMFEQSIRDRSSESNDLVPYWIYEGENGDRVHRRVFQLPFSKDDNRYRRLRKSLSLYRLVFAQPRQEDLMAFLSQSFSEEAAKDIVKQWRINLEPPQAIPLSVQGL